MRHLQTIRDISKKAFLKGLPSQWGHFHPSQFVRSIRYSEPSTYIVTCCINVFLSFLLWPACFDFSREASPKTVQSTNILNQDINDLEHENVIWTSDWSRFSEMNLQEASQVKWMWSFGDIFDIRIIARFWSHRLQFSLTWPETCSLGKGKWLEPGVCGVVLRFAFW